MKIENIQINILSLCTAIIIISIGASQLNHARLTAYPTIFYTAVGALLLTTFLLVITFEYRTYCEKKLGY
jgi:hypothetical protein